MNKIQSMVFNSLNQSYPLLADRYLKSFKVNNSLCHSDRILILRIKDSLKSDIKDILASKVKNSVLKRCNELFDVSDSHKPINKSNKSINQLIN